MENERLLTRKEMLKMLPVRRWDPRWDDIEHFNTAQDAKSYQSGRQDAAREILKEIKQSIYRAKRGYIVASVESTLFTLASRYGVTE